MRELKILFLSRCWRAGECRVIDRAGEGNNGDEHSNDIRVTRPESVAVTTHYSQEATP
ncbi:hypothetical protein [Onishia niordana]|uniref:hypothetical protein n=1 Tax=Onishia niordana TaxID=2508711 RepID=UPI0014466554|nr:hypothetical protein [Halomonas niordiana]